MVEHEKTDLKKKKAFFIKHLPKAIGIGIFLIIFCIFLVYLFYIRDGQRLSGKENKILTLVTIILFIVGVSLVLFGEIAYYSVKRSLLKDLRAEIVSIDGEDDGYKSNDAILQEYLNSLEPSKKANAASGSEKKRKIGKIIQTVIISIVVAHVVIILTAFIGLAMILHHCANYSPPVYETDDYFYCFDGDNEAVILGLTDSGKLKEYLIIPTEIDGRKTSVGYRSSYQSRAIERKIGNDQYALHGNYKKIFLSTETKLNTGYGWVQHVLLVPNENTRAIVFIGEDAFYAKSYFNQIDSGTKDCLVLCQSGNYFDYFKPKDREVYAKSAFAPANVSYKYNYKWAKNDGYYFIDDYDGTVIGFIPPDPTRKGYSFAGWYKEEECINAWDFENDIVPPKNAENNEWLFEETVLYAKWVAEE